MKIYVYPPCSTCKKALKWGQANNVHWDVVHIVNEPPTAEDILYWSKENELAMRKFFNTSGKKYRELNLKDKLDDMTDQEKAELLASDGMLIKRPIVTDGKKATVGFNEDRFNETWLT
ncbi:arsenate reductase family protein [Bacillaceae bacterium SIJ1]|uniref:arsenate reductase family protein n=1 Tax=Litoribacterium kuwaitense TaxID=1398745 RepID=UPI0013EC5DD6|nr:arsenate reductase family protein [Litoribacterium kuwaitense]NGP46346.1 arsenate reductase family protein [Litoribacterium kuwaitense]